MMALLQRIKLAITSRIFESTSTEEVQEEDIGDEANAFEDLRLSDAFDEAEKARADAPAPSAGRGRPPVQEQQQELQTMSDTELEHERSDESENEILDLDQVQRLNDQDEIIEAIEALGLEPEILGDWVWTYVEDEDPTENNHDPDGTNARGQNVYDVRTDVGEVLDRMGFRKSQQPDRHGYFFHRCADAEETFGKELQHSKA